MDNAKIDQIYDVVSELRKAKNSDYGDSYAQQGPVGIIVRLSDKLKRYINITKKSITVVATESVEDTITDLINYSLMYLERSVDDVDAFRKRILKEE